MIIKYLSNIWTRLYHNLVYKIIELSSRNFNKIYFIKIHRINNNKNINKIYNIYIIKLKYLTKYFFFFDILFNNNIFIRNNRKNQFIKKKSKFCLKNKIYYNYSLHLSVSITNFYNKKVLKFIRKN